MAQLVTAFDPPQPDFGIPECYDLAPDRIRLVAASEKPGQSSHDPRTLWCFDIVRNQALWQVPTGRAPSCVRTSPDGSRVAVALGRDAKVAVHDMNGGALLFELAVEGECSDVAWHPDGSAIAVVGMRDVEVWDVGAAPVRRTTFHGARGQLEATMSCAWAPDGRHLAIGTNHPAVYVHVEGRGSPTLPGCRGAMRRVAWHPSADLLAGAGFGTGGAITVWERPAGAVDDPSGASPPALLRSHELPGGWVGAPAWNPNAEELAFGTSTGDVVLLRPRTGEAMQLLIGDGRSSAGEARWRGDTIVVWLGWPTRQFFVARFDGQLEVPPVEPPAATARLAVHAAGTHAVQARELFSVIVRGPDDASRSAGSARFGSDGIARLESLAAGHYWVSADTRADIGWGAAPHVHEIDLAAGATAELTFTFGGEPPIRSRLRRIPM